MTDRLEQLASIVRRDRSARPIDPQPSADDLGAAEGLGLEFPDGSHVGLYRFETWTEAADAAAQLDEAVEGLDDGVLRETATNGSILFVGSVPVVDPDDLGPMFSLAELVSAFAGEER